MYTNAVAQDRPDLNFAVTEHIGLAAPGFIGIKLMPVLPQNVPSGKYNFIDFAELDKQILDNKKVSTAGYNRVERTAGKGEFNCEKYGLEEVLDEDDVARMGIFPAESMTSQVCSFNNLRAQEKRIADTLYSTSVFSSAKQQAVAVAWNTAATATPQKDINNAKAKLVANIGGLRAPGVELVLSMNDTQFDYLLATKEIQDKCIYTRKIADGQVQADELARYFGVDRIEIATGKIKKANIWGNSYMLLSLVSNNQALKSVPRIGNTFLWTGSTASNNVVQSYRDEEKEADIIRVKQNTDEKVISSACGILITGVVS